MAGAEEKPRVLIADPDAELRSVLFSALERLGYEPRAVGDGQSALDAIFGQSELSAIILDCSLPAVNGLQLCQVIRDRLSSPPPIIMLSAFPDKNKIVEAAKRGVADFMMKPVHLGQLVLRLNALVARRREELAKQPGGRYLGLEGETPFIVRDISATGLCLESSFPVPRDSIIILESADIASRLRLSDEQAFPVRVVNCAPSGKRFKLGAVFVGLGKDVSSRLLQACQSASGFKY